LRPVGFANSHEMMRTFGIHDVIEDINNEYIEDFCVALFQLLSNREINRLIARRAWDDQDD